MDLAELKYRAKQNITTEIFFYNRNNLFLTCVKLSDAFGADKPIFLSTFLIIPVQLILNDFCWYIITGYVIGFYIKQSGKRLPQFHTIFGRSSGTRLCSTVLPRPARKPICINRTTTSFTFCIVNNNYIKKIVYKKRKYVSVCIKCNLKQYLGSWGDFFLVTAQTISSKYVLDSMRYAQLQ